MYNQPIIIIGMARSGTTLVSHILGSHKNVYLVVEPHLLWKAGNFKYLSDDRFDINQKVVAYIRNKLMKNARHKVVVEKSPVNCLRPGLVKSILPDAKIVYVERSPIRCIHSNLMLSISGKSYNPSRIFRKYFLYSGSKGLTGSVRGTKLKRAVRFQDLPMLTVYIAKSSYFRYVKRTFPFGPKIDGFPDIVKKKGLIAYHVAVYQKALAAKQQYKIFYPDQIRFFRLERLQVDIDEIRNLYEFCGLDCDEVLIKNVTASIDTQRVRKDKIEGPYDTEIRKLLG